MAKKKNLEIIEVSEENENMPLALEFVTTMINAHISQTKSEKRNRKVHKIYEVFLNSEVFLLFIFYYKKIITSKLHLVFTIMRIVVSALLSFDNTEFNYKFRLITKIIDATYLIYIAYTLPGKLILLNSTLCLSSLFFRYALSSIIYKVCEYVLTCIFDIWVPSESFLCKVLESVFSGIIIFQGYHFYTKVCNPMYFFVALFICFIFMFMNFFNCYFDRENITQTNEVVFQTFVTIIYICCFVHVLFLIGGCPMVPELCAGQSQNPLNSSAGLNSI